VPANPRQARSSTSRCQTLHPDIATAIRPHREVGSRDRQDPLSMATQRALSTAEAALASRCRAAGGNRLEEVSLQLRAGEREKSPASIQRGGREHPAAVAMACCLPQLEPCLLAGGTPRPAPGGRGNGSGRTPTLARPAPDREGASTVQQNLNAARLADWAGRSPGHCFSRFETEANGGLAGRWTSIQPCLPNRVTRPLRWPAGSGWRSPACCAGAGAVLADEPAPARSPLRGAARPAAAPGSPGLHEAPVAQLAPP